MRTLLLAAVVAFTSGGPGFAQPAVEARYTPLDLARCRTIAAAADDGGETLACPGLGGIPVFVTEGDLRFDVDFGAADDRFDSFGPFNTLGPTIEWRVGSGKPFAAILRFRLDDPEDPNARKGSVLAVYRVGRSGAPGCPLAYVDAVENPDANDLARQIADLSARGFRCGRDRARYVGRTGRLSGAATAAETP